MSAALSYFQLDYTDGRYNTPTTGLDANVGRMPVATIGDHSIGQSSAINMYFANEFGLMGSNHVEASQILAINEHLKEMDASYKTLVPWATKPQPGALDTWFDGGAQDIEALPKDTPLAFLCRSGGRSAQAAEHFRALGFKELYNIEGGINAWALLDPNLRAY